MGHERPTVLITAAGSNSAFGIVSALRARYGYGVRLIGADTNPDYLAGSSGLTDLHVVVPPSAEPVFADVVATLCRDHRVDLYIPLLDGEVTGAARLAENGALPDHTVVLAPEVWAADLCHDKLGLSFWLAVRGVTTPATVDAAEHRWNGRPIFVKPRRGYGSNGAGVVWTEEEYAVRRAQGDVLVVQERCSAPEVTIDVFCAQNGPEGGWRAVCRERLEVRQGVCTKARIFEDTSLEQIAWTICTLLRLRGLICIQVMRLQDCWAVIDVNPRMGAGTPMSVAAGVDLISAAIADVLGLAPPTLPKLASERHVVRVYSEIVR